MNRRCWGKQGVLPLSIHTTLVVSMENSPVLPPDVWCVCLCQCHTCTGLRPGQTHPEHRGCSSTSLLCPSPTDTAGKPRGLGVVYISCCKQHSLLLLAY